jgi:hypothetical protein
LWWRRRFNFTLQGMSLARYLIHDIEICPVGLNENWRRGLRVVLRQTLSDSSKKMEAALA